MDETKLLAKLHELVSAVCPIEGVSIGDPKDRRTWKVWLQGTPTDDQIAAANQVLQSFSPKVVDDDKTRMDISDRLSSLDLKCIRPLIDALLTGIDTPAADGKTPRQRLAELEAQKKDLRKQLPTK